MTERAEKIKQILPYIEIDFSKSLGLEEFQSQNLRQILKFQNELILNVFSQFLIENKIDFKGLDKVSQGATIDNLLKQNSQVKQFYLGLICAFFSLDEFEFYAQNKKEINKRIMSLLIERIASQVL